MFIVNMKRMALADAEASEGSGFSILRAGGIDSCIECQARKDISGKYRFYWYENGVRKSMERIISLENERIAARETK